MQKTWTDDRIEKLKELWKTGKSAGVIALDLRVSRNAVIGKVHRLGLPLRITNQNLCRQPRSRRIVRRREELASSPHFMTSVRSGVILQGPPKIPDASPDITPTAYDLERAGKLISLLDLEDHHCRFPIAWPDRLGHGFCGENKVAGQSFCEHHAQRCFAAPTVKRVDYRERVHDPRVRVLEPA